VCRFSLQTEREEVKQCNFKLAFIQFISYICACQCTVCYTMAGIIIATASYDRSIRLWDAASTRCTRIIAPPKEAKNESVRPFYCVN
jgi:WD40 repeat protein